MIMSPEPGLQEPAASSPGKKKRKAAGNDAPAVETMFSRHLACPVCDISYEEPAPNAFSFNSPYGACPTCNGLGEVKELDVELILPDDALSINQEGLERNTHSISTRQSANCRKKPAK